jgi:aminoglycoside 6'-N-acetyltransferase I
VVVVIKNAKAHERVVHDRAPSLFVRAQLAFEISELLSAFTSDALFWHVAPDFASDEVFAEQATWECSIAGTVNSQIGALSPLILCDLEKVALCAIFTLQTAAHGTLAGMEFIVRQMGANDRAIWAEMRTALWPDETPLAHAKMVDELLDDGDVWGLIAEATDGTAIGFAEIAVRKYANGCDTRPVAFLEGVWVKPQFRRRGVGAQLIAQAEAFLAARGFHELGSDTRIDNCMSQAAHLAWGFSETERVVYFRKVLKPLGR